MRQPTEGDPLIEYGLEGMITGEANCKTLLRALLAGMGALGYQRSCFIPLGVGLPEPELRNNCRTTCASACQPVVTEMPDLSGDSGVPNRQLRECHGDLLDLSEAKCSSRTPPSSTGKANWGISNSGLKSGPKNARIVPVFSASHWNERRP